MPRGRGGLGRTAAHRPAAERAKPSPRPEKPAATRTKAAPRTPQIPPSPQPPPAGAAAAGPYRGQQRLHLRPLVLGLHAAAGPRRRRLRPPRAARGCAAQVARRQEAAVTWLRAPPRGEAGPGSTCGMRPGPAAAPRPLGRQGEPGRGGVGGAVTRLRASGGFWGVPGEGRGGRTPGQRRCLRRAESWELQRAAPRL